MRPVSVKNRKRARKVYVYLVYVLPIHNQIIARFLTQPILSTKKEIKVFSLWGWKERELKMAYIFCSILTTNWPIDFWTDTFVQNSMTIIGQK